MNHIDLTQAFIVVADTGSLQKAARQLYQTEAAVSRKLSKLEAYLGVQLLWRHRSGARLTDVGQRYYHQAKLALQQFKQAERLVKNELCAPSGILTVVANTFYVKHRIMPKLDIFLKQYPAIDLKLEIAEVLPAFQEKNMDILFGVNLQANESLIKNPIDTMRYVICAAPSYLNTSSLIASPTELLQHDFIVHSAREIPEMIILDDDQRLTIRPKLWINQSDAIITAAKQGLGIIWVPEAFVKPALEQGELVEVLQAYTQQTRDVYAYYRHEKYIDNKVQAFMAFFS